MATLSVSELVLFIAALTVAAGVTTTLTQNVQEVSSAVSQRGDDVSAKIGTEIELINDPGKPSSIYDNSTKNITLLVKNTGNEPYDAVPSSFDVIIDGRYMKIESVNVVGDSSLRWQSGEVVELTINQNLAAGEHRVVVYVNEDEDLLRFRTDDASNDGGLI